MTGRASLRARALATACTLGGCSVDVPPPTDPEALMSLYVRSYTDSAVRVMQNAAYYRRRVDWPTVRAAAQVRVATAKTPAETYPTIRWALEQLGDGHSFLQPPSGALVDAPSDSLEARIVGGRFAYLRVPRFSPSGPGSLTARVTAMADTLQALVAMLDAREPCGWIVELRRNTGGNMWPMLVGVAPVLGAGPYGSFVDADDKMTPWWYEAGAAGTLSASGVQSVIARASRTPVVLRRADPPVAVLTDSLTASSGEAIAVAFRGRAATRSFGAATYGVPTANSGYGLPDGASLILTVAVDADRTGRRYESRIAPDQPVPQTAAPAWDDATVAAATTWLATQPACTVP